MARDRARFLYIMDMPWPVAVLALLSACLFVALAGARVVYKPYRAPSGSMQPAIDVGDYFLSNQFASRDGRTPQRGDIIVFRPSTQPERDFVKRVVAIGGDRVQVVDGVLTINGAAVGMKPLGARAYRGGDGEVHDVQVFTETLPGGVAYTVFDRYDIEGDHTVLYDVPQGAVFVLGDDRDNSSDSRLEMGGFGTVPVRNISGKMDRILLSRVR